MAGEALPNKPDDHGALNASESSPSRYAAFVSQDNGVLSHITLTVQGVNCAGCIQKIESALHTEPSWCIISAGSRGYDSVLAIASMTLSDRKNVLFPSMIV